MPIIVRGRRNNNNVVNASSFEAFYENYLARQKTLLDELMIAKETMNEYHHESEISALVDRAMAHFKEYYLEKSRMIISDVFQLFSQTWLTRYEKTYLWITGFNPESALDLALDSVSELTIDQCEELDSFMTEVEDSVDVLDLDMRKIQVSLDFPHLMQLDLGRQLALPISLKEDMERLVVGADLLRCRAVEGLVEVFEPMQSLKFFVELFQKRLNVRWVGKEEEARRALLLLSGSI